MLFNFKFIEQCTEEPIVIFRTEQATRKSRE